MKTFLVTLKIDNGATFKIMKFLVHAETAAAALEQGVNFYYADFAGNEDLVVWKYAQEFRKDSEYLLVGYEGY